MKKIVLDRYEKNIEKNVSTYKQLSAKKSAKIEQAIDKANEKRNISLRVNKHDLEQLRVRAEMEGIPYQTLISSILHRYITNQLVNQKDIIKSIQILNSNT
jgi:predicted DNA binding CopG/RHH family protein